jgi:hypothetical protein
MRGLIARPEWNSIIREATQSLWLYGMAEMGMPSTTRRHQFFGQRQTKGATSASSC